MASNKETSSLFKMAMFFMSVVTMLILFFMLGRAEKTVQVAKPVSTAKVVAKMEVASRVVRDGVYTESNAVTMLTVASKKQREAELRKQIAEAMKEQQ